MRIALLVLLVVSPAFARGNRALLGVVAVEKEGKVVIDHVLPDTPASKAGLQRGDELHFVADREIERAEHVGAALASAGADETVELEYTRAGRRTKEQIRLSARRDYKGAFLKRRALKDRRTYQGETGFEAPPWFAYAWSNVGEGKEPPTRANTKGKIVVFHTFQSW